MAHAAGDAVTEMPRIAYDARPLLGRSPEKTSYLRAILAGHEQQIIGFCAGGESDSSLRLVAHGYRAYPLWEQITLPRLIEQHNIETFIATCGTAPLRMPSCTKLVLFLHDLAPPDQQPRARSLLQYAGRSYRSWIVPRAVRRADTIVTASNFSASQIITRFAVEPSRLCVIPRSVSRHDFGSEKAERRSLESVLIVTREPHIRNLDRALEAFALCRKMGHPTLRVSVAGVTPKFQHELAWHADRLGVLRHVEFLPPQREDEMHDLYRRADVLMLPSAEGLGVPMLEAMASGLPVVSSNAGSLPEMGGAAALYFDPASVGDMAAALDHVLSDWDQAARMAQAGFERARQFDPDAVQPKIKQFWQEIAGINNVAPKAELVA